VILTGAAGLLYTAIIVHFSFHTPISVVALSVVDGILTTMPVILVVCAGILLADVLIGTGALKRIGDFLCGRVENKPGRALLLSFGLGNVFEGVGIIAEPLTAPLFYAEGFNPEESAALSILGYSGLLTLEFAGIIMMVLSLASGINVSSLIMPVAVFSIIASSFLFLLLPYVVSSHRWSRVDYGLLFLSALVLGALVLFSAKFLTFAISGVVGGVGVIGAVYVAGRWGISGEKRRDKRGGKLLYRDVIPYGIIVLLYLVANLVPPLKESLERIFSIHVEVVKAHTVTFRPIQDIYTFLFLAGYVAVKADGGDLRRFGKIFTDNLPKSTRAAVAMGLFGAIGQVISFSGFDPSFSSLSPSGNIATVIAKGLHAFTGIYYLLFVPFLGWAGTFLTGYGIASIMLFAKLQVGIGGLLGIDPALITSVLAVGAGIGSISSPFKVAIATPLCNGIGKEPDVLRKTIPAGIGVSLLLGLILFLYCAFGVM
jgi:lactate permease